MTIPEISKMLFYVSGTKMLLAQDLEYRPLRLHAGEIHEMCNAKQFADYIRGLFDEKPKYCNRVMFRVPLLSSEEDGRQWWTVAVHNFDFGQYDLDIRDTRNDEQILMQSLIDEYAEAYKKAAMAFGNKD